MRLLLVLLLLSQQSPPDRDRALADAVEKGVSFPPADEVAAWKRKGQSFREVLEVFLDKATWTKALRRVDRRLGVVGDSIEIRVYFVKQSFAAPCCGGGTAGKGSIGLDAESLANYWRRKKDHEARAPGNQTVVPPPDPVGMIAHEIAHCYQGGAGKQPAWFLEGLATYAADDWHFAAFHRNGKEPVKGVGESSEYKYAYGRGWAWFEWWAQRDAAKWKPLMEATLSKGVPVEKAAAELAGQDWAALLAEERAWSAKWMEATGKPR